MQSWEDIVNSKKSEEHPAKPYYGQHGSFVSPPPSGQSGVEENSIDEPGYEGPGLLGVPAPVCSPGGVGPDCTGNDAGTEPEKAEQDAFMGDIINHFQ